jgi:hypothetical protein
MQMETEGARLVTGHHFVCEHLLFYHEQEQFLAGHLLDRLRRRAIDPTAHPIKFGLGVNAEFDRFVRGNGLGGC